MVNYGDIKIGDIVDIESWGNFYGNALIIEIIDKSYFRAIRLSNNTEDTIWISHIKTIVSRSNIPSPEPPYRLDKVD